MRATGWLPDGPEHAFVGDEYRAALPSPIGARPEARDLRVYSDDPIRDQGGLSECVGFAMARAIRLRSCVEVAGGLRARPVVYPSSHAIYALARDLSGERTELPDDGSVPRLAVYACATYGVVADARWPFDPETVTRHVPPDVLRAGADAQVSGFTLLPAGDFDAIRDAIAAGYPVVGGIVVDDTFERYTGGVMPDDDGTSHGRHMLCFTAYGPDWLGGDNSWGTGWGDGGRFAMCRARAERIRDLYALHLAPEVVS